MSREEHLERVRTLGILAWSWVGIIVLTSIVLFVLYSIHAVLMPFIYALLFVYVLRPVVNYLDDKGLPRTLALLLSYVAMAVIMTLFGMYVGPILYREANGFMVKFPEYITVASDYVNSLIRENQFLSGEKAADVLTGFSNSFKTFVQEAILHVPTLTANVFGGVLHIVLAPIIAFYILKDLKQIRAALRDLIPERHRVEGMHIVKKIDLIVGGFLKGQALVALSVGVLSGLALYLLGLDYAILLGFLICIFNIIPYLGPIVGGAPAVIIALGTSWQLALVVAIVLVVIHEFDSIVISPRIMSQQVNLHPAVVIFALLTGGTLMGVVGMLVAIPVAAVGKALYLHFREREAEIAQAQAEEMAKKGAGKADVDELRSAVKV